MSKLSMWWSLKGEWETKRRIGKTCQYILLALLGFFVISAIVILTIQVGWLVLWVLAGACLLLFMLHAAYAWTD